jgi:hypothetical protein
VPILHLQLSGHGLTPDGRQVALSPAAALQQRGPVVQVVVSVAQSVAEQVVQQGGQLPPPASGLALIVTRASVTCVDDAVAQLIGAPVIDVVAIHSATHPAHHANVYPVRFEVVGLPIALDAPRAIGAALQSQGIVMLIGRELLQHCTLFYNGITGAFTLAI